MLENLRTDEEKQCSLKKKEKKHVTRGSNLRLASLVFETGSCGSFPVKFQKYFQGNRVFPNT